MPLPIFAALAVLALAVALVGASQAPVTARETMGSIRTTGEPAFVAAHRGDSAAAPENTLSAVRAAIEGGFEYVEVDVALTADRVPVLLHDATVDRTTDGTGALAEMSLADVRALDAGSWRGDEFSGTRIPTAAEFFDLLEASETRAIVELKGEWDAESVAALVDELEERRLERSVALASFDARTLAFAAAASDVVQRLAILRALPEEVVPVIRELGAGGVIVGHSALAAHPRVVRELHDARLRVIVYTLNEGESWQQATDWGVDGIVTDAPSDLREWRTGR